MGDAATTAVNAITSRFGRRRFVASAAAMPVALGAMHTASAQATVFDQLISEDVARLAERYDAGERTQAPSSTFVIYLSKTSVVHPAGFEPATFSSGN